MKNRYNLTPPQKEGLVTTYPDGWSTGGSWAYRLDRVSERYKLFENLVYLDYVGTYDDRECVGVYLNFDPEQFTGEVEEMFLGNSKPDGLNAYSVTMDIEGNIKSSRMSIWPNKILLNSSFTSYIVDNSFYNDPTTYLLNTLWATSEDEAIWITDGLRKQLIEQGKFEVQ